jgi:PIN domain nuclease of toxin-antitoxin system
MRLLLDTVTFLDSALAQSDLSPRAKNLLVDSGNELYVSIVSYWEIAIKFSRGRLELPGLPEEFVPEHRARLGADILALDEESAFHIIRLPHLHADPFDRILICQAIVHGMVFLTPDARVSRYSVRTAW